MVFIEVGAQLAERGISTVGEALRDVVGASVVQEGSFGGLTSLFLRGGQSDYTKVLVDGVPLNDPGGAIDLAQVATENVDRIEIVRGPASVLYGSDALGGVVNVVPREVPDDMAAGAHRVSPETRAGRGI